MTVFPYQAVLDTLWEYGPMTIGELTDRLTEALGADRQWVHSKVRGAVQLFVNNGKVTGERTGMLRNGFPVFTYSPTAIRECGLDTGSVARLIVDRHSPGGVAFDRAMAADDLGVSHEAVSSAMSEMSRRGIIVRTRRNGGRLPRYHVDPRKARFV